MSRVSIKPCYTVLCIPESKAHRIGFFAASSIERNECRKGHQSFFDHGVLRCFLIITANALPCSFNLLTGLFFFKIKEEHFCNEGQQHPFSNAYSQGFFLILRQSVKLIDEVKLYINSEYRRTRGKQDTTTK